MALSINFTDVAERLGIGFNKPSPERLAKLDAAILALQKEKEEVAKALKQSIQFEQIPPDSKYNELHKQLLANERVHPLESVGELVEQRIGDENSNKRCFARVSRRGSPKVTAGIFTALVRTGVDPEEMTYGDIPGNIDEIKNMPVEPFSVPDEAEKVVAILYTISSDNTLDWEKGGGRPLASAVHQYLSAQAEEQGFNLIISTLSPVRNFSKWLSKQEGFENILDDSGEVTDLFMDDLENDDYAEEIKKQLLHYLVTEKDIVLNFHLGNGAFVGDLKINKGNKQDFAMVNYVYPATQDLLMEHSKFYNESGIRLLAPHLEDMLGLDVELRHNATPIPPSASI